MEVKSKYHACDHQNKKQPDVPITEDVKDSLSKSFRVLPIYEKGLADYTFSKSHSLQTNKFLHCRWLEYQRIHIVNKPDPFVFPSINDFHFYKYDACYNPDLSISARPTYRYWLKFGPGVDKYGEMPIPSDVGFRKTGMMVEKRMKIFKPKLKIKKPFRREPRKALS